MKIVRTASGKGWEYTCTPDLGHALLPSTKELWERYNLYSLRNDPVCEVPGCRGFIEVYKPNTPVFDTSGNMIDRVSITIKRCSSCMVGMIRAVPDTANKLYFHTHPSSGVIV